MIEFDTEFVEEVVLSLSRLDSSSIALAAFKMHRKWILEEKIKPFNPKFGTYFTFLVLILILFCSMISSYSIPFSYTLFIVSFIYLPNSFHHLIIRSISLQILLIFNVMKIDRCTICQFMFRFVIRARKRRKKSDGNINRREISRRK
jgi:hypothetical protein